jgi:hypothetical protein
MKLSDFSPAVGILTGEGAFGNLASKGMLGPIAEKFSDAGYGKKQAEGERDEYKKKLAEMQAAQTQNAQGVQAPRMKAGGKVSSASKRADGCCVKGKTKGRMV